MHELNRIIGLVIFLALIAVGYFFAGISLERMLSDLSPSFTLVFIFYIFSIVGFWFLYKARCERKSRVNHTKSDCTGDAITASILYVFFTGVIIIFIVGDM